MPLNSQFEHGRIALKPLAYKDKALAQPSELMIDYKGEHPSYHIYIVDPMDETRIIDITNYMVKEAFGNDIAISIDGMTEQMSLHDIINFIYKLFLYPDNLNGYDYNRDFEKIFSKDTIISLLRNIDGTIFMPVTKADAVFDNNGTNLQERLDNMVRLGFANAYIKATQEDQTVFEIQYPFLNYTENGNYMELRIGTTYIDKDRYQLIDNRDENGDVYGCTITFFADKIELGRRIDVLFIYNAIDGANGSKAAINGGQIASYSIPISKLEKTVSNYITNDASTVATGAAVYKLYNDLSEIANASSNSAFFINDMSFATDEIIVDLSAIGVELERKNVLLNIVTASDKVENVRLTVTHGQNAGQFETLYYDITIQDGIAANRLIKVLINDSTAQLVTLSENMLTEARYIHLCEDAETVISFTELSYDSGSIIRVYRNGVRLFKDLDYSMDKIAQTITLFVRTELDEKIVFEALNI